MPILEAFRLAFRMIWAQKLKSGFSVIGVFIGVTFLIAVWTVVEGMNQYMTDSFANFLGAHTYQVRRFPGFNTGEISREQRREWQRRPRISYDDARAIEAALTVPVVSAWESERMSDVVYEGLVARDIRIIGATPDYFEVREWKIAEGRAFSAQEANVGRAVLVIGEELATRLFPDEDPIGREVRIRSVPYRIIGIVESQGNMLGLSLDKFAVAPALSPVKRWINPTNLIDGLLVKAPDEPTMLAAMAETEAVMRKRRGLRPAQDNNFVLETSEALLDFWGKINQILAVALPGLVSISLVVGGIVIMNIMLMSVSERTREIGIRKALGAKRRDIRRQFLVESAALAVLGATLGIGTGLGVAWIVEAISPMPASISPVSIVLALILGGGVGIGAGIYPAARAAKLDPVNAMRQE
ncbi:MAG: ABC transporter permease [Gemmatimonadota bacterium]|nr:ABC transporter permease [Gemmatimonadota bacterium]